MRIRWRGLELPSQVTKNEDVSTPTYGRFIIEPFERGFGTTVGNGLRRVLLSSLEGAAVTSVKIAGADHEFASLPGVLEDVTDIILNIKRLVVRLHGDEPKKMWIKTSTKGEVRAGMIECDPAVETVNEDLLVATLTDDVKFEMELAVGSGRGYLTAEENEEGEPEIGVIPVDSIFTPVTRVRYRTEETRVGQRVNYDRLILEIWTNGTILPEDALVEAAKILRKHLNPFIQYHDLGSQLAERYSVREVDTGQMDEELQAKLAMPIADFELSVRASNCLESAKIATVGELVNMTEADLLKVRSFGKTSLREVKRKLQDIHLGLGLDFPEYRKQSPGSSGESGETADEVLAVPSTSDSEGGQGQ